MNDQAETTVETTAESTTEGYQEKLISVRRTAKVVKGGRIFSFSAFVVVGDGKGRIGFGNGKAREVPTAIQKATAFARQDMKKIDLRGKTIQHPIEAKHVGTRVIMKPAQEGTGIIAGSTVRAVFEVLGVENVIAKCIGSSTPHNVVQATLKGLLNMRSPESVAAKKGMSIETMRERMQ